MAKKGFDLAALAREQMGAGMAQTVETVREIALDDIDVNAANFYEKSNLDDLAANIELLGLIQPVAVKRGEGGRWTLIDGERRYQAVRSLGWKTIRAVEHRPASSVMEELMLLSANMQQRKMSSADLSKQAKRYTECLADLKRSGVNIPGRLRAAVAEAFGVSESRIAKLNAIRANLIPELLARFDAGAINEAAAYGYSQLPAAAQDALKDKWETAMSWRLEFAKHGCAAKCPDGGEPTCAAKRAVVCYEASYAKCTTCCLSCPMLRLCGGACEASKAKAEAMNADYAREHAEAMEKAKADADARRAVREADIAAAIKRADEQWTRFKSLREAAGVSLDEVGKLFGEYSGIDADDLRKAEDREDGYLRHDEGVFAEVSTEGAMEIADLLGSDVYTMIGRPCPGGWDWRDGSVELPGEYVTGTICCWGAKGFRAVNAQDYEAAHTWFPGEYDWWCVPVPPAEFETNTGEDEAYD